MSASSGAPERAGAVAAGGPPGAPREALLSATEGQPHARLVLGAAIAPGAQPSHAYLFNGPAGTGKRAAALALAGELLAADAPDPEGARRRARAGSHPDLTWVRPTGAHVMRVGDVDQPVVAAAGRTPFEASRRVFVLERVEAMNDEVANRLLKTLEEPPPFVHLILLTDALGRVLQTVTSRCQLVRFAPLAPERIAAALEGEGVPAARAAACGRLALGNGERARTLASEEGKALRAEVEAWVLDLLAGEKAQGGERPEPWRALLERAEVRRAEAEEAVSQAAARRLDSEPAGRERRAIERDFEEAAKREGRRARTEVLDLGLTLAALALRDLACLAAGADDAVLAVDRLERLSSALAGRDERALRAAAERCEETRASLELNVSEELALTALGFRIERSMRDAVGVGA